MMDSMKTFTKAKRNSTNLIINFLRRQRIVSASKQSTRLVKGRLGYNIARSSMVCIARTEIHAMHVYLEYDL